jgi:hypothetical protein
MMKRLNISHSHLETTDFSSSKKDTSKMVLRARLRKEGLEKFKAPATALEEKRSNVLLLHVMVCTKACSTTEVYCWLFCLNHTCMAAHSVIAVLLRCVYCPCLQGSQNLQATTKTPPSCCS